MRYHEGRHTAINDTDNLPAAENLGFILTQAEPIFRSLLRPVRGATNTLPPAPTPT